MSAIPINDHSDMTRLCRTLTHPTKTLDGSKQSTRHLLAVVVVTGLGTRVALGTRYREC